MEERRQIVSPDVELFQGIVVIEMRRDRRVKRELHTEIGRQLPDAFEVSRILPHQHASDHDTYPLLAQPRDSAQRSLQRATSLRLVDSEAKATAMVGFAMACALELAPDLRVEGEVGIPDRTRERARAFVYRNLSGAASEGSAFSRFRFQWSLGGNDRSVFRYVSHWLLTPNHEDWASLPLRQRKLLFLLKPWRLFRFGFRLLPVAKR